MKDHLLSIFPLQGMEAYARLSCIVLEDSSTDCSDPFTVTRSDLVHLLSTALPTEEIEDVLARLDHDHTVQLPISTDQARLFGFVPKVN